MQVTVNRYSASHQQQNGQEDRAAGDDHVSSPWKVAYLLQSATRGWQRHKAPHLVSLEASNDKNITNHLVVINADTSRLQVVACSTVYSTLTTHESSSLSCCRATAYIGTSVGVVALKVHRMRVTWMIPLRGDVRCTVGWWTYQSHHWVRPSACRACLLRPFCKAGNTVLCIHDSQACTLFELE